MRSAFIALALACATSADAQTADTVQIATTTPPPYTQNGDDVTVYTFGPTFILSGGTTCPANSPCMNAFKQAAQNWGNVLVNHVTIRISVGMYDLGAGVLGQTSPSVVTLDYAAAQPHIPGAPPVLTFWSNTQNGVTLTTTRYLESGTYDTLNLNSTTANARALGLLPANDSSVFDGGISFSTRYKWQYNHVALTGYYDFVGIATHEMGHLLGFMSGVDDADQYAHGGYLGLDTIPWVTPLDLSRCKTAGAGIDLTVGGYPYRSTDGCTTKSPMMAGGVYYGSPHAQASHWKTTSVSPGVMQFSEVSGHIIDIKQSDIDAMGAMGWTIIN